MLVSHLSWTRSRKEGRTIRRWRGKEGIQNQEGWKERRKENQKRKRDGRKTRKVGGKAGKSEGKKGGKSEGKKGGKEDRMEAISGWKISQSGRKIWKDGRKRGKAITKKEKKKDILCPKSPNFRFNQTEKSSSLESVTSKNSIRLR